jgi:hypothetical protein
MTDSGNCSSRSQPQGIKPAVIWEQQKENTFLREGKQKKQK